MTDYTIELSFTFYYPDHTEISNDIRFQLRRQVANMFELCRFGEMHQDGDTFWNEHLVPATDEYVERNHELFILVSFPNPPEFGDLGMIVSEGIPTILNFIRQIPGLQSFIRMFYG